MWTASKKCITSIFRVENQPSKKPAYIMRTTRGYIPDDSNIPLLVHVETLCKIERKKSPVGEYRFTIIHWDFKVCEWQMSWLILKYFSIHESNSAWPSAARMTHQCCRKSKGPLLSKFRAIVNKHKKKKKKKTPWSESASELYRPSDRRLSAKLLPTCADRGCHVVSVTDPSGRILGFLDRSRYFSIK
jgi:hypothetical protein